MSFFKVGNFIKAAAVGAQVVPHGLGETPKIIMIWGSPATADTEFAGLQFGIGTTVNQGSIVAHSFAIASTDAVATTATARSHGGNAFHLVTGANVLVVVASMTSVDATNFTLNWSTNNATAYRLHFVAIGGAYTKAKALYQTLGTGLLKVTTGIGFPPECFMLTTIGTVQSSSSTAHMMIGLVDENFNQMGITVFDNNAVATSISASHARAGQVLGTLLAPIVVGAIDPWDITNSTYLSSMDPDGYTIADDNLVVNGFFPAHLAMRGLRCRAWKFGKFPGDLSTFEDVGFKPDGVIILSTNNDNEAFGQPYYDLSFMIGASDGVNHASTAIFATDQVVTTDTFTFDRNNAIITVDNAKIIDNVGTIQMNNNGFTVNWSVSEPVDQTSFLYIAFAAIKPGTLNSDPYRGRGIKMIGNPGRGVISP